MTGRRENPLTATGDLRLLAERLRKIRESSRVTYRQMEPLANYTASALSQAAGGQRCPTWDCVEGYLKACGFTERAGIEEVRRLWESAATERQVRGGRVAADQEPDQQAPLPEATGPEPRPAPDAGCDPRDFKDFLDFVQGLKHVREKAGLSVKKLIEVSEANAESKSFDGWLGKSVALRKTTVYDVMNGKVRPSEDFTIAFVAACGLSYDEIYAWGHCYRKLQGEESRAAAALKALTGTTPALPPTDLTGEIPPETDDVPAAPPTRHRRIAIRIVRPGYTVEISEETLKFTGIVLVALAVLLVVFLDN
jgi:hypothetical protein